MDESSCSDEVPWAGEKETLVVGIGMAHGEYISDFLCRWLRHLVLRLNTVNFLCAPSALGNASDTVVVASVCLDKGCMRLSHSCFLQGKSSAIVDDVMRDIIKASSRILPEFLIFTN